MAERPVQLTLAWIAAALVAAVTLVPLGAVVWRASGMAALSPADIAAIRFTLWQAALSAALSVALAIPLARALARRGFPGRGLLVTLLGAPFILPVIVAIFGLLAVFGANGLLGSGLTALGLTAPRIYGLHGVVLAHVFFNLPLATRLILQGWSGVPAERFRLAASLGMTSHDIARLIEWPMLRSVVPGALAIIFVICTTSFAVALALGGGPRATTIELAIYQAFRFDFDPGRAALLASVQVAVTGTAVILSLRLSLPDLMGRGLDRRVERWDSRGILPVLVDAVAIGAAALFLLLPMSLVLLRAIPELAGVLPGLVAPVLRSLCVALVATALTLAMALPLALASARPHRLAPSGSLQVVSTLGLAVSPLVIGTGLFILFFPIADPAALALPLTAVVNAVMALPFALRILVPAAQATEARFGRLADSLGMEGPARLRWLILPRLRRPLGFAAGLAAALSMGDLGVIALFGAPESGTLPLEMYRLMAAYRMDDAAAAALVLTLLSLGLFWLFDRGGRLGADI